MYAIVMIIMNEVYILTEGSYSDYHIVGVVKDKEDADFLAEKFGVDVETWKLGGKLAETMRHYDIWFVRMTKEGDVKDVRKDNDGYALQHVLQKEYKFDIPNRNLYTMQLW